MLSIFKNKPTLRELIPNDFVDIHSHMLPGIDDGAKEINDTKNLFEAVKQIGFKKIITTPHTMTSVWENTTESITDAYNLVKSSFPNYVVDLNLGYASEYFLDENLIKLANQNKLLTLKSNFVLIELSFISPPIQLYDYLFDLQLKGYKLVLAHPERYLYLHNKKEEFKRLKKAGCQFQLNLLATVGYYGREVQEITDYLLKNEMYDFVGSDIHNMKHVAAFGNKIGCKQKNNLEKVIEQNQVFL
ncbi:MAG: histidinol phosphatase [Flavobacterium sp.]|jgi:protein-tyrosine phosphatase|nr:histidinol phosphatase [Flavobacterium sp.]